MGGSLFFLAVNPCTVYVNIKLHDFWILVFMQELMNWCNYCPDLKTWMEIGRKPFEKAFAVIILFLQLTSPVPFTEHDYWLIHPAEAVLYSPETKIPRTGELALRRAIPANKDMKAIQV